MVTTPAGPPHRGPALRKQNNAPVRSGETEYCRVQAGRNRKSEYRCWSRAGNNKTPEVKYRRRQMAYLPEPRSLHFPEINET